MPPFFIFIRVPSMTLEQIDKTRYRKHLNIVIVACIAALVVGSLGIARLLILALPSDSGSHFHWNLLGVVVSCIAIGFALKRVEHHPFMTEVVYVWRLKQALNQILASCARLRRRRSRAMCRPCMRCNLITPVQGSYGSLMITPSPWMNWPSPRLSSIPWPSVTMSKPTPAVIRASTLNSCNPHVRVECACTDGRLA